MHPYCFLNGKIVKTDKPHISLDDIGILRGYAAFQFIRIYNGIPFLFSDYYKSFVSTSKVLGLKVPYSEIQLEKAVVQLIKKNKVSNAHARIVITGGKIVGGMNPSKPHLYIIFENFKDLPNSLYTKGAKLMTYEHERLLPQAKTTNYIQAVQLQGDKNRLGAVEILYKKNGWISETTTSNIFIVKNGILLTPREGIFLGNTRRVVIDLAKNNNIKVIERNIKVDELFNADEVFITATAKKVLPIVKIDGKKIGNGKVGDVSRELLHEYKEYIKAYT